MSNLSTLKINSKAKGKLDTIKKKEKFTTFSDAITSMCSFFELNKISPDDGLNQGYQNSIFNIEKAVKMGMFDLKKQFIKDSQSMRKLMRAIEKDHIINLSTKVAYLYEKNREEEVENNVKNDVNSVLDSSKNDIEKDKEINILKDLLEDKNDEIKSLKLNQEMGGNLASKYEESLKVIYQNYQIEKTTLSGKERIYINMDKEGFDKLFDI